MWLWILVLALPLPDLSKLFKSFFQIYPVSDWPSEFTTGRRIKENSTGKDSVWFKVYKKQYFPTEVLDDNMLPSFISLKLLLKYKICLKILKTIF